MTFNFTAISESRIKSNMNITINIILPHYSAISIEYRGISLYTNNKIAYKPRKDLDIYKSHQLEKILIEIVNNKKSNIIIGVVYRYVKMDLNPFKRQIHKMVNM